MNEINSPSHYTQGKVECIEAMEACSTGVEFYGHLRLTAMKYLWRLHDKDSPLKNTQKAKWYLLRLEQETSKSIRTHAEYWDSKHDDFMKFLDATESCFGASEFLNSLRFFAMKCIWSAEETNHPLYRLNKIKQAIWCVSHLETVIQDFNR